MSSKELIKEHFKNPANVRAYFNGELQGVKWNGSGQGIAHCPFHNDQKESLSIKDTGAFFCHSCGVKGGDVIAFHRQKYSTGFSETLSALAGLAGISEVKRRIVKTYDYCDASGRLIFQTVRYEPKDFRQRRPDPNNPGKWLHNLDGVSLVPYNLPKVVKSEYAFIVEGEKDCETLSEMGLIASCNPMGALKWRPEYNQHFRGKRVYILPDNDSPGREHALQVARSLKGFASMIKIIQLPGLPDKGDVSDWVLQGGTKDKLIEIVKAAPEWQETETAPAEVKQGQLRVTGVRDMLNAESVKYLIDHILIKDTLTMLSAYAATGKSLLSLAVARSILTGDSLFGTFSVNETGGVLLIDEENPSSFLKERLQAFGFSPDMPFYFLHYQGIKLDNDIVFEDLCKIIEHLKPKLTIIDSLIRVHSQKENDAAMSFVMGRLRNLVQLGTSILLIHHHRKGAGDIREGIRGHSDIIGGVDVAFTLEAKDDHLLLSCAKSRTVSHEPIRLSLDISSEGAMSFKFLGDEGSEITEVIYSLLSEHPEGLKQMDVLKAIRGTGECNYGDKKIRLALRKGEGVLWDAHKGGQTGKAIVYRCKKGNAAMRPYIYIGNIATLDKKPQKEAATLGGNESLQTLDKSKCGNAAGVVKNHCHINESNAAAVGENLMGVATFHDQCSNCMLTPAMRALCDIQRPCPRRKYE